jgi:hypothetical protein
VTEGEEATRVYTVTHLLVLLNGSLHSPEAPFTSHLQSIEAHLEGLNNDNFERYAEPSEPEEMTTEKEETK